MFFVKPLTILYFVYQMSIDFAVDDEEQLKNIIDSG